MLSRNFIAVTISNSQVAIAILKETVLWPIIKLLHLLLLLLLLFLFLFEDDLLQIGIGHYYFLGKFQLKCRENVPAHLKCSKRFNVLKMLEEFIEP